MRSSSLRLDMMVFQIIIFHSSGISNHEIIFSKVDFHDPEGPMIAVLEPSCIVRLRPL